ncbi:hypothetical protein [Pseudomonas viridiflava]|uniref:hypothetical protein n=1 Tax=Pseudomonas viridiflava TaxID=33069 RepID=UPI001C31DAA1|nr:hypothetical protein [Pseudomonas viridiflava]QXG49184.1 hypothetical protein KTT57_09260 [Pseudomonas viridiflava]
MTIDWSKAPDGATHLTLPNSPNQRPVFWRVAGSKALEAWPMEKDFSVVRDHFRYGADGCPSFIDWLAIPKPEPWTGECLPPVGAELEAGFAFEDFEKWHKGVCIAVGECPEGREEFCVVRFGKKIAMYTMHHGRMRPIRTAEQIAADERQKKISQALDAINNRVGKYNVTLDCSAGMRATVEAMIDAGFVQQVAP